MKTKKKIFVKRKVAVQPFLILLIMIVTVIAILIFMFFEYSKAEQEKDASRFVGFESSPLEDNGLGSLDISTTLDTSDTSDTSTGDNTLDESVHGSADDAIETTVTQPTTSTDETAIETAQNQLSQDTSQENDAYQVDTLVPKTIPVDDSYFEDALFIGDSILKGFKSFVSPYPNNVIADQNAGLDHIFLNKDIYLVNPSELTTLWKGIEQVLPDAQKIYVLIGTNGIPGLENDKSMNFYDDLIVKLKERFPEKVIYICAVTPLTKELSDQRAPSFSKEKIDDFNNQLFVLCQNNDVYFLQTDEDLKDSSGYLMSEYDAGDGLHLNKSGHTVLFDYFKTHIVSEDGISQKVN